MPLKPVNTSYKAPPYNAAQSQTHRYAVFPAPTKGLDASAPLVAQDPLTAGELINWWNRKWGPELRGGWKRWTTNLGGIGTEAPVNTLMAYWPPIGSAGTFAVKMFAACGDFNIYDVTDQTDEATVPVAAQNIPGQTNPGRVSWINFATGGTNYLCCVVAGGGYWTYSDAAGWVDRTGSITGAGAAAALQFDHIMVWKRRIWFIRANTTEAYYLDVDAIQGACALFDFGPLLKHGGELASMASWTLDAGDGLDDKLVIIGRGGDVVVYAGTDPADPTAFGLEGKWFVGKVPDGRQFASDHGGDLSIITTQGIEYMSRLQQGRGLLDPETVRDTPSYRYNEVIGRDVKSTLTSEGWSILYHPGEEAVIVTTPHNSGVRATQYIFSVLGTAWSKFNGLPIISLVEFDGELYFGTSDGKVGQLFTANTDDELSDGTAGTDVIGTIQTAYVTDPDNPMSLKRPQLIMPMFQSSAAPSVQARINTEWSVNGSSGSPSFTGTGGSEWNNSLWNTAIWGTAEQAYLAWLGCSGLGVYVALRMRVAALPGTIFTSWKFVYESGGIM